MNARLLSEDEKSFTVDVGGKEVKVVKTPGTSNLLGILKKTMSGEKSVVPGKARVPDKNTPKNDTVTIRVSPGEGIIPIESMQSLESAHKFVEKMFANKERQGGQKMNKGGKACYAEGGETKKPVDEDDEDFVPAIPPTMVTGTNYKHYAKGGIVTDEKDDDDKEEGIDEPVDINGSYSKGGKVKDIQHYDEGGVTQEDPDKANADFYDSLDAPAAPETPTAPVVNTKPVTPSLYSEDGNSFTVLGPNGLETFLRGRDTDAMYDSAKAANSTLNAPAPSKAPAGTTVVTGTDNPNQDGTPTAVAGSGAGKSNKVGLESSTSSFQTTSPEAKKMQEKADAEQKKANEAAYTVEETKRNLIANTIENQNLQTVQANDAMKARMAAQQAAMNQMDEKARVVEQEAMDARLKGDHLWGDEGTGNRVLAAIGLAMGGFGQAFNGKQNPAIDIINKAIDRDIEIQKANAAQKGKAADIARNQFSRMKEIYGDENIAKAAVKAMNLEQSANDVKLIEARSAAPEAKAKLQKMNADLMAKSAEERAKVDTFKSTKTMEEKPVKGNALHPDQDKELRDNAEIVRNLKKMRDLKKLVNTGFIVNQTESAAAALGLGNIENEEQLRARSGVLYGQIAKELFGALQGDERKRADRMIPNFNDDDDAFNAKTDAMVGQFTDRYKNMESRAIRGGYDVPKEDLGMDDAAQQYGAKKKVK